MELDFSREWRIIGPGDAQSGNPESFAVEELEEVIGRCAGCVRPVAGDENCTERIIVLDYGRNGTARDSPAKSPGRTKKAPGFSWRASPGRVEIYGRDGPSLLRGVYDFLDALGARWPEPGAAGERLPRGPILGLASTSRTSSEAAISTTLILGHGAFLEDWENRLTWAARAGYASVFVHTTPHNLALGAAPERLYDALRSSIAATARRLGLAIEMGGHGLSSFLPRALFKSEPELFREHCGKRSPDRNFCPSSERALAIVAETFASWAKTHPEVTVFHAWPDDLPEGGWCSCTSCATLSPAAQSLAAAKALAAALALARPDAAISFLAYHDTEDIAAVLGDTGSLPNNLELLWAPRRRSWGRAIGDTTSTLNTGSLAAFHRAARAWHKAGGGRVSVFEYYEDAVLFKGAVPPLISVLESDLEAYRGSDSEEAADAICILCAGGRLPLAPRPNAALLPRIATALGDKAGIPALLPEWAGAAYGPAADAMLAYWSELEAAWAIDLDMEEGETEVYTPDSLERYVIDPPADWGDPWKADLRRLAEKRGRCEKLFDHLRRAEAKLAEAEAAIRNSPAGTSLQMEATRAEAAEYAISDAVLELDCARVSAYHELAAGDARAAADIANLALSASGAVRKALRGVPDRRARRETGLLIEVFYDLRLRAMRRVNARSAIRRLFDLWYTMAHVGLGALRVSRAYEPSVLHPRGRPLARNTRGH
jgi:hypothetical protein